MTERSDLAELAKRRGFFFPSNDAYGGTAGLYTYGPEGAALKRNIEAVWRDQFVRAAGHMELESPTVVPEAVFEASGTTVGDSSSMWPAARTNWSRQTASMFRLRAAPSGPYV